MYTAQFSVKFTKQSGAWEASCFLFPEVPVSNVWRIEKEEGK